MQRENQKYQWNARIIIIQIKNFVEGGLNWSIVFFYLFIEFVHYEIKKLHDE